MLAGVEKAMLKAQFCVKSFYPLFSSFQRSRPSRRTDLAGKACAFKMV